MMTNRAYVFSAHTTKPIASIAIILFSLLFSSACDAQEKLFRIRTITAGVSLRSITDTASISQAIMFLKSAREAFRRQGYEVQTLRISTQNFHEYLNGKSYAASIAFLKVIDKIARRDDIAMSIGGILPPDVYKPEIAGWALKVITETENINFSIPIASTERGIFARSIQAAAEVTVAIAQGTPGGEGNFRFTASANCPSGIPFFPAAIHAGKRSFAIGLETPNLLADTFSKSDWTNAKTNLKSALEAALSPIQLLANQISKTTRWDYDGIDTSPAPGLDASIGGAIEQLTGQPFGGPSTLRACALITDVLKNVSVKTCGYSGLMLPIIEDKVLSQRASEGRFTVQELLLFSSVSGTGLDVVPLPGNTSVETVARIFSDVAALSLKYTNKALSARLFLIPGKVAGERVTFENIHLTPSTVMSVE